MIQNLRLFHVAVLDQGHSRSFRCVWLLEELDDVEFEVILLNHKIAYSTQMTAFGVKRSFKIPTLLMDGLELSESGVISQIITERFGGEQGLMGSYDEQIELQQWISFAETCITFRIGLIPKLMDKNATFENLRVGAIDPMREVFRANIEKFENHFRQQGSDYLLQSGFSIADTMCGWSLFTFHEWGIMDLAAGSSPLTLEYLQRLRERPAFQRAEKYANGQPGRYSRGCVPIS